MLLEHCALTGCEGQFQGVLHPDWEIWGPNGGYLSAMAMNAVAQVTPFQQPISYYGMYLSAGKSAQVDLKVTPLRVGRNTGVYTVEMLQGGRTLLHAQVITGNEMPGYDHQDSTPPYKSSYDQLQPVERETEFRFWDNFECRFDNPVTASGKHSGVSEWGAWYRFLETKPQTRFEDAMRSLVLIDTLPWPANFMRYGAEGLTHMAPSLDVYVQFHRFAVEEDWMYARATCEEGALGYLGGKAWTWDANGRLLASGGTQLICRPMPQNFKSKDSLP